MAALLGEAGAESPAEEVQQRVKQIPIELIRSSARNPRQIFNEADLDDLASSIKERGIIQPIVVRPVSGATGAFEIIAGERRWRAAQRAGYHQVPALVLQVTDRQALELSIVENVQRTDLNPFEEARGYAHLAAEYDYTHADIGRVIGKSRSHVANTLRLLALPEHTKDLVASGSLTAGHARALLSLSNPDSVADQIVDQGLSVREVERLSSGEKKNAQEKLATETKSRRPSEPSTTDLINRLSLALGATVDVRENKHFREIRIRVKTLEQVNDVCDKLLRGS